MCCLVGLGLCGVVWRDLGVCGLMSYVGLLVFCACYCVLFCGWFCLRFDCWCLYWLLCAYFGVWVAVDFVAAYCGFWVFGFAVVVCWVNSVVVSCLFMFLSLVVGCLVVLAWWLVVTCNCVYSFNSDV